MGSDARNSAAFVVFWSPIIRGGAGEGGRASSCVGRPMKSAMFWICGSAIDALNVEQYTGPLSPYIAVDRQEIDR